MTWQRLDVSPTIRSAQRSSITSQFSLEDVRAMWTMWRSSLLRKNACGAPDMNRRLNKAKDGNPSLPRQSSASPGCSEAPHETDCGSPRSLCPGHRTETRWGPEHNPAHLTEGTDPDRARDMRYRKNTKTPLDNKPECGIISNGTTLRGRNGKTFDCAVGGRGTGVSP